MLAVALALGDAVTLWGSCCCLLMAAALMPGLALLGLVALLRTWQLCTLARAVCALRAPVINLPWD